MLDLSDHFTRLLAGFVIASFVASWNKGYQFQALYYVLFLVFGVTNENEFVGLTTALILGVTLASFMRTFGK